MTWLSSRGTWPLWSSASPLWRPELRPQMQALDAALEGVERKAFTAALESETRARFDRLAAGIESYRRHPVPTLASGAARPVAGRHHASARLSRRHRRAGQWCWRCRRSSIGPTFSTSRRTAACCGRLAAAGTRPLLVDWGAPGDLERGFTLTDYIAGRLEQALDHVLAEVGGPRGPARLLHGRAADRRARPAAAARPGRRWSAWPRPGTSTPSGRRRPSCSAPAWAWSSRCCATSGSCRSTPSRRSSPASTRCR